MAVFWADECCLAAGPGLLHQLAVLSCGRVWRLLVALRVAGVRLLWASPRHKLPDSGIRAAQLRMVTYGQPNAEELPWE